MNRRKVLLVVAALVAALGAALVFVYAQGAENRAADKFDTVDVLVATQQIERGESTDQAFAKGKITVQPVPQAQILTGATSEGEPFTGTVALTTIYPNEQLMPTKFGLAEEVESASRLPTPKGKVAISVSLTDTGRVGSFTQPGSTVAVFLTGELPPENVQATQLLLSDVLVLATGSTTQMQEVTDEEGVPVEQLPNTLLTLAVTQKQAERVLFGQSVGELAFALLNESSKVKAGDGTVAEDLFDLE